MNNGPSVDVRRVSGAQSIRRAVALLHKVSDAGRDGASVAELASRSGLDRTTTHRIIRCLVEEGLLGYRGGRHGHVCVLGPLAFEIGLAAGKSMDLRTICRPALARIAGETGDTVFLMVRAGYDSVCVERLEGSYPIKSLVVEIGNRRPLGIGAGSLAILSAMPPNEMEAAILHNAQRIATFPGMSVERLRRLAARARAKQYASLEVTGVPSAGALAVALRTPSGDPVAALSVSAIKSRMTRGCQMQILAILRRESNVLAASLIEH